MPGDKHELRSYGRRRGRKPSARQADLLREDLPRLAIDPAHLPTAFAQTWLEIGFGGGEHLLWQARQNSDVALIGCEPFEDGVIKVLSAVAAENLTNVRLHMGDVREILKFIPPGSVDRAFILFPDLGPNESTESGAWLILPCWRSSPAPCVRAQNCVLAPISAIMLAQCSKPLRRNRASSGRREAPPIAGASRGLAETRYEAKAIREGRRRYYLRFVRR